MGFANYSTNEQGEQTEIGKTIVLGGDKPDIDLYTERLINMIAPAHREHIAVYEAMAITLAIHKYVRHVRKRGKNLCIFTDSQTCIDAASKGKVDSSSV